MSREDDFGSWVNFSDLNHVDKALYENGNRPKPREAAINTPTKRISLTSLGFGITTDLFVFAQVQKLTKKSNTRLLDIGCGEPALFQILSNSMNFPSYVGIDTRIKALSQYGNSKNCVVIADDILETKAIKNGSVDVAVLSEVLEHLEEGDGLRLLERVHKWLKPGGHLIVTVPIKPKAVDIDMDIEWDKWGHLHYYEYDELVSVLVHKFTILKHYFGRFRPVRTSKVRRAVVKEFGEVGSQIFDDMLEMLPSVMVGSMFTHYLGDEGGHSRFVMKKKVVKKRRKK